MDAVCVCGYDSARPLGICHTERGCCKTEVLPTVVDSSQSVASAGFTLIELVMVIVILGILALGTTRYIVQSTEQYTVSAERTKLIAGGRVAVEKITRRVRNALPNSVRVSASGRCVEYFPVLAGTSSLDAISPAINSLNTSSFNLDTAPVNYAVIAVFAADELYLSPLPSPGVIVETSLTTTGTKTSIPLDSTHTFLRTSPTERVYVAGSPERFCFGASGQLTFYSGYGIPGGALTDTPPGSGSSSLVAENIVPGISSFSYTLGTLVRNAVVSVVLNFDKNGDPVRVSHEVQIRNVP